jgi:dTDP-4-dehydrorhamnose 3,5-epimerase
VKVVRAVKGALWDVIVGLRAGSSTCCKWFGAELNESNRKMMYVPRGFGHGFVTLADNVEALYLDSAFCDPRAERGALERPDRRDRMAGSAAGNSEKDRKWPSLNPEFHGTELMRGLK